MTWIWVGLVGIGWLIGMIWLAWELKHAPLYDNHGRPVSPVPDTVPDDLMKMPYDFSVSFEQARERQDLENDE